MIYISITIVPNKINEWEVLKKNLNSLLNQKTNEEYSVILSIPKIHEIPPVLFEFLNSNPRLVINQDVSDYGELTKIIGTLSYSNNPEDIIIVCNCNYIYHEEMLDYQIKKLNENPKHAICFNGENGLDKKTWNENGEKRYVFRNTVILVPTDIDRYILIPSHAYSVGYKRSYFKDDFNEEIWNLTHDDDLIMAYYLKIHETWPLCVKWDKETDFRPRRNGYFPVMHKTLNASKEYTYNKDNMNDTIKKLLYYNMEDPKGKTTYYIEK